MLAESEEANKIHDLLSATYAQRGHRLAVGQATRRSYQSSFWYGYAGDALLFADAFHVFGESRYATWARGLLTLAWKDASSNPQPGLLTGVDGILWAGCRLAELGLEVLSLDDIARVSAQLDPASPDLGDGEAGRILVLLRLFRLTQHTEYLERASDLADGLEARQPPELVAGMRERYVGFAHGLSGIGYSASQLACFVHGVEQLAISMLQRTLAATQLDGSAGKYWPVFERSDSSASLPYWCHGTAGIVLSLLHPPACCDLPAYSEIRKAVGAAVSILIESAAIETSPGFCHGRAGIIETLLEMATTMPVDGLDELEERTLNSVATAASRGVVWAGRQEPLPIDFANGASGLLHALLRAIDPTVPHPTLLPRQVP